MLLMVSNGCHNQFCYTRLVIICMNNLTIPLAFQMFTVMTKMVLQTKKEQKDRQMETNNPLRLHNNKTHKRKQKCC